MASRSGPSRTPAGRLRIDPLQRDTGTPGASTYHALAQHPVSGGPMCGYGGAGVTPGSPAGTGPDLPAACVKMKVPRVRDAGPGTPPGAGGIPGRTRGVPCRNQCRRDLRTDTGSPLRTPAGLAGSGRPPCRPRRPAPGGGPTARPGRSRRPAGATGAPAEAMRMRPGPSPAPPPAADRVRSGVPRA